MNATLKRELNRIRLVDPGTGEPGHFTMGEFANEDGIVMAQPSTLWALERIRADVNEVVTPARAVVVVANGVRLDRDNARLAERLGWIGETAPDGSPGRVSRTSMHLASKGASGADFYAIVYGGGRRELFPMRQLGAIAERYFDKVLYYEDHIHGDQRDGGKAFPRST